MAPAISFDAQTKRGVLERLVLADAPQILRIVPLRPVADATPGIEMIVHDGQVYSTRSGTWSGTDALLWVAMARSGRVEVEALGRNPEGTATSFADAYGDADIAARALEDNLAPIGGIGGVLVADLDGLVDQLAQIPDAANAILRLVDGERTIAAMIRAAGHDASLTARILRRLYDMKVVGPADPLLPAPSRSPGRTSDAIRPTPSQWQPPDAGWGESSALPNEEEIEAVEAKEEIVGWLSVEDAPPPLLSQDAFTNAFAASDPRAMSASESEAPTPEPVTPVDPLPTPTPDAPARVRAKVPLTTRRPEPAPADETPASIPEDDEALRAAGVGSGPNPALIIAVVAVAVLLAIVFALRGGDDTPSPPRDAGVLAVLTTTTATVVTTSSVADGEAEDGKRPTIAGPDAPEDVKRAERLLDAGRYREAASLLSTLRQTRPDDAAVFVLSGQVFVDMGKLRPAQTMANRALSIDRRSYRAWVLKGSVDQFRGRKQSAIDAYKRAAQLGPNHPMAPEIDSVISQLERTLP